MRNGQQRLRQLISNGRILNVVEAGYNGHAERDAGILISPFWFPLHFPLDNYLQTAEKRFSSSSCCCFSRFS